MQYAECENCRSKFMQKSYGARDRLCTNCLHRQRQNRSSDSGLFDFAVGVAVSSALDSMTSSSDSLSTPSSDSWSGGGGGFSGGGSSDSW